MSSSSTATTPYTQSQLKSLYNISGLICQNLDQTLHMLLTEHDVDVVTEAKKAFNLNTRILGYDVVFIFKEQDLGYQYCIAHRQILSEACNYFANLLGMTKEWQHQACSELPMVVHIENISWKVFQLILEYIYTNNLESLQKEHVLEILTAVDMISFQKMQQSVLDHLFKTYQLPLINKTNACAVYDILVGIGNQNPNFAAHCLKLGSKIGAQWRSYLKGDILESTAVTPQITDVTSQVATTATSQSKPIDNLSIIALCSLLDNMPYLSIENDAGKEEEALYNFLVEWSSSQSHTQYHEIFQHLAYRKMSLEFIVNVVSNNNAVGQKTLCEIMMHHIQKNNVVKQFSQLNIRERSVIVTLENSDKFFPSAGMPPSKEVLESSTFMVNNINWRFNWRSVGAYIQMQDSIQHGQSIKVDDRFALLDQTNGNIVDACFGSNGQNYATYDSNNKSWGYECFARNKYLDKQNIIVKNNMAKFLVIFNEIKWN